LTALYVFTHILIDTRIKFKHSTWLHDIIVFLLCLSTSFYRVIYYPINIHV